MSAANHADRQRTAGFTLIEVMAALAILAIGLTWMIKSTAGSVRRVEQSRMSTIAVELARGKMYDIEEALLKDGFLETDQSSEGDFGEEGWPLIKWKAEVRKVELPSLDKLTAMSAPTDPAAGAGTGTGSGTADAAQLAAAESGGGLFGMLAMMGGGATAEDAAGGGFIAAQFTIIQQVLEASVRKVVLTVSWKVLGEDYTMDTILYLTDPAAMTRVIGGIGGAGAGDYGTDGEEATTPTPRDSGTRSPTRDTGGGK